MAEGQVVSAESRVTDVYQGEITHPFLVLKKQVSGPGPSLTRDRQLMYRLTTYDLPL